jgi:hypothetical protein
MITFERLLIDATEEMVSREVDENWNYSASSS